jgi:regulator of protease activity HflC (stomatin/prohibitin superfamily)
MSDTAGDEDLQAAGPWGQSVALAFRFLFFVVCAIAVAWCVSNIRKVPADSQAVVMRFGSVVRVQGVGLLLAWPEPIEQVVILPSAARQIEFRVAALDTGTEPGEDASSFDVSADPRQNAGFLLTGDSNVVHLQATLFYQITDPVAYMVSGPHIAPALQRLFIASAVVVCAGRDLDSILVARPEVAAQAQEAAKRERLRADLVNAVNRRLDDLAAQGVSLGIHVSRVDLAAALPIGAKTAFDDVLTATQNAETDIAVARTKAQISSQQANREKDRILTDATARAEETTSDAQTRTAPIAALAQQAHDPSRTMLLTRLYYDRASALLKKAGHVEAVDPSGSVHVILPGDAP